MMENLYRMELLNGAKGPVWVEVQTAGEFMDEEVVDGDLDLATVSFGDDLLQEAV